jgi:hypothetical protein
MTSRIFAEHLVFYGMVLAKNVACVFGTTPNYYFAKILEVISAHIQKEHILFYGMV